MRYVKSIPSHMLLTNQLLIIVVTFSNFFAQYHMFLGNYVLTIAVAIIGSLAFESPIVIIEKILFGGGSKVERPAAAVTTKSYAQKDCA